ncbi:MAG: cytochrome b/b6 domain-containing protein [Aquabacterium sp.]
MKHNTITQAILTAVLACTAAAAHAHGNVSCPDMPKEEKRLQMDLQHKLESEGWKVRQVKNYNGCYEVYGLDGKGRKAEAFFDAQDIRARLSRRRESRRRQQVSRRSHSIEAPSVRVWDLPLRSLHWLLALSVITAWASGHWQSSHWFDEIHHTAGYVAVGVVICRLLWGFIGGRYARFAQFVRGPRATLRYAQQVWQGSERRYIGHNPLGACMVVALLLTVAALGLTGFLYTTEWLWGYEWLENLHAALGWLIVVLVPCHVAGVALSSRRHHENLVAAMLDGRKRAAEPGDID